MTDSSLCPNSCGWYHYFFMKSLLKLKKRTIKIGAPNFWPSNHYNSVVQTASYQNLQKIFNFELQFMRYWNLKFVANKADAKFTALQNCAGKKQHTFTKIKTHQKLMEH